MKILPRSRALIALALLVSWLSRLHGEDAQWSYRGFRIEGAQDTGLSVPADVRGAIEKQIDIVYAVGFTESDLQFFQSVPFVVMASAKNLRGSPGLYQAKDRVVRVTPRIVAFGSRPVLLHELLHAYQHQKLPSGFRNQAVLKFFEKAKASGAYAPQSHMMQNPGEFFACAATTYLFGVTGQEPFSRAKIKDAQPELFDYLQSRFGPNTGQHTGSLGHEKAP